MIAIILNNVENQKIKFSFVEPTLKKLEKKNQTTTQKRRCKKAFFKILIIILVILQINSFYNLFRVKIDEIPN